MFRDTLSVVLDARDRISTSLPLTRLGRYSRLWYVAVFSLLYLALLASPSLLLATEYIYDDLNRLEYVIYPDGTVIRYVYDNVGNRLEREVAELTVALSASPASPQAPGTQVTFTGAATGGSGVYEYQFEGRAVGAPEFSLAQAYGGGDSVTWATATVAPGAYEWRVLARSVGSTAAYDATQTITYLLEVPPATGVTLSAGPASPQAPGTQVTFTGAATGGSGVYEYEFWGRLVGATEWGLAQSYGASNSWVWTSVAGTYEIKVNARSVGSTAPYDAMQTIPYVVD